MWGGISRTTIDGVEVFWADAPGPPIATLTFRVGTVDETLYSRGITHMVEHLVLQPLALQTYSYNGFVDQLRTTFTVTGEPAELAAFLRTVCAGVSNLPVDRFEHERKVLLTESGRHEAGGLGALLATRYGPRGPGLLAYDELGLHHLDEGRIRDWAEKYFRPENAVLWLNREPPPDLSLPLDPGGSRRPAQETAPVALPLPAWLELGDRGVAVAYVHPRSAGGSGALQILERRLQQDFRYERGIAYEVGASYLPLTSDTAHSTIWTDVLKENAPTARDALIESVRRLTDDGPTDEEMEQRKRELAKANADPLAIPSKLDWVTQLFLLDPAGVERDVDAEIEATTAADVQAGAGMLASTAIYSVPTGTTGVAGYQRVPESSADEVRGRVHRPVGTIAGGDQRLVIGDDGLTLAAKGRRATIRFDRCEAMLQWDNGYRVLFGSDGFVIQLRPADWQRGKRAVAALDERLADRGIAMSTDPPDGGAGAKRSNHLARAVVSGLLGLSAVLNALDPAENDGAVVVVIYSIAALALFTFAALSLRTHLRRDS